MTWVRSLPRIPWADPVIEDEEKRAIADVLDSGRLTQGPRVAEFERLMAAHLGVEFAVAVSSGTAALEILFQALGLGRGDEVIVPSMTYFATAASVSRVGATPVFVDVHPSSFNLDADCVERAVGPRTRAIVFIDFGGTVAAHEELTAVAHRHRLLLIQDAAQSLGAVRDGRPAGADVPYSAMSFHMAKMLTTVEGGMIFTSERELASKVRELRSQGEMEKGIHTSIGTNARMTEMQAAIGLSQFERMEVLRRGRKDLSRFYAESLRGIEGVDVVAPERRGVENGDFLFRVLLNCRDEVCQAFEAEGIEYRITYPVPVYRQPAYVAGGFPYRVTASPVSEWFARRVLALPMSSRMSASDRELICTTLIKAVRVCAQGAASSS
ncbi:DegT/DnrJ/EryC1/StrS family aminotransferase [Streptomyces sp. NPDC057690]|uniref:DegT/DnrJ/EryC1/StrS family aminotransferase n=1 Tax=Streptomyces sp. NPDC057690 TaxID=3346214 RepID=UPI0036A69E85